MRILHIADIHGRIDFLEWSRSGAAPAHNILCLSGDFIDIMGRDPAWKQRRDVRRWLKEQRTAAIACSGNHDLEWTPEGWEPARWIQEARSDSVVVDGGWRTMANRVFHAVRWGGLPATAAAGGIVVMHQPPAGCTAAIDAFDGDNGDEELASVCSGDAAPMLVVCGHVHMPRQWCSVSGRTVVVNPGFDGAEPIPRHVLIDLSAKALEWRSASGTDRREWPQTETS